MNSKAFVVSAVFSIAVVSAHAGRDEINVAKGVIKADYTLEKCNRAQTPDAIIKGQVRGMRNQGISSEDIQQGFQEGMMEVEMKYPGNTKPPRSECNKAQYLYDQFLKFL